MINSPPISKHAGVSINLGDQGVNQSNPVTSQLTPSTVVQATFVLPTPRVSATQISAPQLLPEHAIKPAKRLTHGMEQTWRDMQLANYEREEPLTLGQLINRVMGDPTHELHGVNPRNLSKSALHTNPDHASIKNCRHLLEASFPRLDITQAKLLNDLFAESGGVHSGDVYVGMIHDDPQLASLRGVNPTAISSRLKIFRANMDDAPPNPAVPDAEPARFQARRSSST